MVCYQIPVFLLLNVVFCSVSGLSEEEMNQQSVEVRYDYETGDPMFGDVDPVPTPSVCSEGTTCGFLIYDDPITGEHEHTFTHYCHCPDGLECIREGINMELRYFYSKCRNTTEMELLFSDESSVDSDSILTENKSEKSSSEDDTRNLKRLGYVNEEL